jgi:hypothetical protein
MSAKIVWDDRFTMLMACASPGSALAYLDLNRSRPSVLRRDTATIQASAAPTSASQAAAKSDEALTALIASGRVLALP